MTLWLTGLSSANGLTPTVTVGVKRTVIVPFSIKSLTPISTYTFWCNDVDMTWATRQFGKKLGAGLLSDANGKLSFEFHGEMINNVSSIGDYTKYYTFQLKDLNGNIKALSIMPQNLKVRV